mgnify:CR=1 FL=1
MNININDRIDGYIKKWQELNYRQGGEYVNRLDARKAVFGSKSVFIRGSDDKLLCVYRDGEPFVNPIQLDFIGFSSGIGEISVDVKCFYLDVDGEVL